MTTDQGQPPGGGSPLGQPPGVPEGMFLELPKPTVEGEVIPPVPVEFGAGLTGRDAKGHRWAILRVSDGTVTADIRIPWQVAAQVGAGIAQGLAAVQAQAAREQSGGLILPNQAAGGLLIPQPAGGWPPRNGARRG